MAQKQHEVLAVKSGILGKFTEMLNDLVKTFSGKQIKFQKKTQQIVWLDETRQAETINQLAIETTVPQELAWIGKEGVELLDNSNKVNATNCIAKADVIMNSEVVLKDIPVTTLLELEKISLQIKEGMKSIPTLDGSCDFKPDTSQGFGVYKARDVMNTKTELQKVVLPLTKATEKFAETVQVYDKNVIVANVRTSEWAGFITVADKAALLSRIEDFIKAVKQAQARANATEVIGEPIGAKVLNIFFGPLLDKKF